MLRRITYWSYGCLNQFKNDRNKTIENINNSDMIFSLKRKFKPFSKKNKINWIQLVE